MNRFEYQFNNTFDPEQLRRKKRLRLAVIFILISAVTAGIIYLIVPKNIDTDPAPAAGENTTLSEQTVPENPVEKAVSENKTDAADPAPKQDNAAGVPAESENNDGETSPQPVAGQEKSEQAPVTDEPQKGKVWKGDPVNDVPPVVESRIPESVILEDLKSSFGERNYGAVSQLAVDIIMRENEGSPIYRTAAEYLRRSKIEELASKEGVSGVSFRYTVRGGDSLSRIARRNKTTVQALMSYNQLANGLIRIGNKLTVTPGPWKIVVSRSNRLLKLHQGESGKLFCVFEVGIGRGNSTPRGEFVISTRLKDPKWYAPHGRIFEPGEEGNELGKYYLKLAAVGDPDRPLLGYGIHGTPDENTVGSSVSSGCIRMRSADIEMLYNLVPEKTPVVITE